MESKPSVSRASKERASSMNPEKIILAMIANQQETTKFLMALMEKERRFSNERENDIWRRAEADKKVHRDHADTAIKDVLKTKIVSKSVNEGRGVPAPVQQTMPFVTNGSAPSKQRFRPGIDDAATP